MDWPPDRFDVELIRLSRPESQHSTNLLQRPEAAISVFDSGQPADTGVGLQFAARAERVPADGLSAAVPCSRMRLSQQALTPARSNRSKSRHLGASTGRTSVARCFSSTA